VGATLGRVLSPASRAKALVVAGVYAKSYWRERLGLSSGQNNRDDEPEARLEWVLGSSMLNRAENARTGTWHEVTVTYQ
jgi:hypothetical protein